MARAEQVAENDARLIAAAREVFIERGYHAASLDQVAEAAGLTKGAVYARFDSKADLMFALLDARIAERAAELAAVASETRGSPDRTAAALGAQWQARSRKERGWALLFLEFRVHVARDKRLSARFAKTHARMRHAMAAAIELGGAPPGMSSEDAARVALAVGTGFALERLAEGASFPDDLYARTNAALVRGLTAKARAQSKQRGSHERSL